MEPPESRSEELWAFTLACYPRAGVQPAVIGLQDRWGADVNLLFLCCWVGASGRGRLAADDHHRAERSVADWKTEVTLPLRAIRDRIKQAPALGALPGASDARGKVLAAEIESERVAQIALEDTVAREADPSVPEGERLDDAAANLTAYLDSRSVRVDEAVREQLLVLLGASFPDLPDAELARS